MSVNKVILLGRLGQDPDIRMTPNGQQVATVSLATSKKFKDSSGAVQEKTEWHRCVLWGKKADLAAQYLKKGREVYFEGEIQTRSWEDQSGQKRYSTEIIVDQMNFIGGNSGGGGDRQQSQQSSYGQQRGGQPSYSPPNHGADSFPDEDVPF